MINYDLYEDYADATQRPQKTRSKPQPKKSAPVPLVAEPMDALGQSTISLGFGPSLNATSEERAWLADNLGLFYHNRIITSVLRRVKGGKEANVYCCAAHPETGLRYIAAKVYRPRQFRNLKNDSQYRQGRAYLDSMGKAIGGRNWRMLKAIEQKTRKGQAAQQMSWVEYEFLTLQRLYQAGGDVPQPIRHDAHVILMDYFGDEVLPAPALCHVALDPAEARPLFERLLDNIALMLKQGYVHGDLSAYNVLYWHGQIKVIDFPQVVSPYHNPDARAIFNRDVERVCQYFARYGVPVNAPKLAHELWEQYFSIKPLLATHDDVS